MQTKYKIDCDQTAETVAQPLLFADILYGH